jgi:hypothetical protein
VAGFNSTITGRFWFDRRQQLSDLINLAIAIFTAIAAKAAWDSAKSSQQAVEQANRSAEDSRKIAEEQTKALLTAAKANALASRIEFYNEQIRPLVSGDSQY